MRLNPDTFPNSPNKKPSAEPQYHGQARGGFGNNQSSVPTSDNGGAHHQHTCRRTRGFGLLFYLAFWTSGVWNRRDANRSFLPLHLRRDFQTQRIQPDKARDVVLHFGKGWVARPYSNMLIETMTAS